MSFADNFNSGRRGGPPREFALDSFVETSPARGRHNDSGLSSVVTNGVRQISSNVTSIERLTGQLGSSKDGPHLREQLNTLIGSTRDLCKDTTESLKALESDRNSTDRIAQQKITKDLQFWVKKFQESYKAASDRERSTPLPSVTTTSSKRQTPGFPQGSYEYDDPTDDVEKQGLMDSHRSEQFRIQNQSQFNNNLILDREKDIKEIEKNVVEVNEIFRDLSALVADQGVMIDSIESNIEEASVSTSRGAEEIVKASKYQKSSRNKLCCLLLLIVIIVAVLMLFLWLFVLHPVF